MIKPILGGLLFSCILTVIVLPTDTKKGGVALAAGGISFGQGLSPGGVAAAGPGELALASRGEVKITPGASGLTPAANHVATLPILKGNIFDDPRVAEYTKKMFGISRV